MVPRETFYVEFIPQIGGSQKETILLELLHYSWNTKRMRIIRSCVHSMVGFGCEIMVEIKNIALQNLFSGYFVIYFSNNISFAQ